MWFTSASGPLITEVKIRLLVSIVISASAALHIWILAVGSPLAPRLDAELWSWADVFMNLSCMFWSDQCCLYASSVYSVNNTSRQCEEDLLNMLI